LFKLDGFATFFLPSEFLFYYNSIKHCVVKKALYSDSIYKYDALGVNEKQKLELIETPRLLRGELQIKMRRE